VEALPLWSVQGADGPHGKPRFIAVASLEDVQAVRTVAFHPEGSLFVVGANSKTLRICRFPPVVDLRSVNLYTAIAVYSPGDMK